jgi:hypothetical protein
MPQYHSAGGTYEVSHTSVPKLVRAGPLGTLALRAESLGFCTALGALSGDIYCHAAASIAIDEDEMQPQPAHRGKKGMTAAVGADKLAIARAPVRRGGSARVLLPYRWRQQSWSSRTRARLAGLREYPAAPGD